MRLLPYIQFTKLFINLKYNISDRKEFISVARKGNENGKKQKDNFTPAFTDVIDCRCRISFVW